MDANNLNSGIKHINDRIRKSLPKDKKSVFDLQEHLQGIHGLSQVEGQKNLNTLSNFFAKRMGDMVEKMQKASFAQLKADKARLENLHGMAKDTLQGSEQGRGVFQQYQVLVHKLDEELTRRKQLTFKLGDFLKKNSIDAISITAALTSRNPVIGLGIKYILERRKASKEEADSQRRLSITDSLAYRDLLQRQKSQLLKGIKPVKPPKATETPA
jgi:hypothetical protein